MSPAPIDQSSAMIAFVGGQGRGLVPRLPLTFEHRHGGLRFTLGGQRHAQVGAQPVAAIHQRMRTEAQASFLAVALAHEPGVAIGRALVGVVAPHLPVKVVVRRLILIGLGSKTFCAGPGFNERAVHREVLVLDPGSC
jgi:hypothetical protein